MNVLITEASGFVGRRLVRCLESPENSIRVLSRRSVREHDTVLCDFLKDEIPEDTLDSIDAVFHLAGYAHDLQDASKIEDLYHTVNVDATVKLARLAVKSGVKQFIYVSSVKAGGTTVSELCMTEKDQSEPEGIYGQTKREAELELLTIGRLSGMHISIIRPSLVYGPGVRGNLALMKSGIKKGWFPPLPETRNRRSLIHVDDLVQSLLIVVRDDRANGEIFIVTDGVLYSSREIYEAMCQALGKVFPKWHVPVFLFNIVASMSSSMRYKVDKLLGNECYSSEKIQSLGFKAERTLKEMNETNF